MNDGDNKRKLYDALSKDYDMGTFEQFSTDVEDEGKRKKLYEAIKGEYDLPDFDGFTRQLVGERSQVQQPAATPAQQEEHSPYQMAQGNTPTYNYGGQMPSAPRPATPRSKGNTQPTQTAAAQPLGPEKFAKQMQFEQRMRQRVPSPEAMMQDFSQRMENIRKGNQPFGSASEQRYNPETGKMETVYFTKSGEEVSTPMEQQRINREVSDPVGSELREAYAERDRINKEIDRRTREVDKANEPSFAQMLAASEGGGYNPVFAARSEDPELSMLWTAKRKNEARIKTLEREGKNEGFFRTLGKTLFSLDTWDFGLFDLIDAGNTMAYGDKKLKGSLGEAQESMMENTYRANVAQQQYGENDTFWQRAGEITGNAIPFVAEFALTGGYSGLTQAGTKAGSKMAAKYATGKVGQWVIKNTGTLVGDMAAGFAMANTTGGMKTAADIINRHQGQLVKDEDGDYVFDGGKSWGRSIYEGEMANTLEYYTEKLGVHLDGAGKVVGGLLGNGMERMGAGRVSELFNRITGSEWAKITGQVLRKGGVQDYPSEVVEEEANILLNSLLVGDNKFSDFVDGKTQADIWGGMMLSIGFMQSPGMVGGGYQTAQYYRYKHKTDMSDRVASTRLTPERWEPWRERIDNTTNEDMRDVISDIIGSQELQDEEKKAAINYVGNLMQMRGYNLRTTADAKDKINGTEAVDEAVDADNESYQNGYEADEQSRRDIAIEYSMNPDDEVRAAAVEGVRQRIEDDADIEVEGWREEGRKMMHSDGSMRPAVLKVKNENGEDTEVYIVEGNVQMMADGTMVDPETSDRSVVIYDPATGERRMIDPTSDMGILSIGEATSAEDFEYEIQRRRDEYVQRMLDETQGTVRVELGQPLTMPDGREGTVMAISPDGESFTVVANDGSGEEVRMERSDLQQIADAAALADYQARHQEDEATAEQPTEEETDEPTAVAPGTVEGAPTEFLPDMDITILDDAGNEQPATVIGRVRYERGKFVPDETGNIVEYVVDGQVKHENTAKLAEKVVSHVDATLAAQETAAEQPAAVEQPTVETPTAEVETPAAEPVVEATGTVAEQPTVEPMPMREDGEADFLATTPERGHQFIYNEAGLSREEAGQFVKANLLTATKALDKAKKDAPKMGTSLVKYKQQQAEHQAKVDAAQQAVDYWQGVKATQSAIVSAEMAEQAERDRVAHEAAVLAEQQRQAEEIAKQEEQAALGSNAVAPQIVEKWQSAPKLEGAANEITLADGSKVKGHYVIVESGAATPSHNPNMGFVRNDGFPIDENGQTVNDRDYERDQDAQQITRQMADSYDSRAIQNVPVVSPDGVVLSGNGRTMAGELAAQQGTDGEYIDHLKKYPQQFGFEPQQFDGMAHPRLLFVADEAMPYTTETFAKFNQQDMKSQSRTEQSVKMGKTVDDNTFGRIIRSINSFDSLADFYNDPVAASNAIGELHGAGAINNMQLADMMDGEKVSGNGRQTLENMLIGKAFESNPDAIRQLAEFPAMRQSVVSALAEIANNIRLGQDYSLESELAQAINLAYQARKNGVKAGDKVSWFARQQSLFPFDTGETVADFTNATVLMLADCINDSRVSQLKKVLGVYNQKAESSAAGQYNIFSGVINSKSDILKEVTDLFDYGTAQEQQSALDNAVEQRKQAAAVQQPGGEESVPKGSTVKGSDAGSVAEEVTEPQATEDHGQTERTETDRRDTGDRLRDAVPSGAQRGDSGVDIGSLAEGLAAERSGDRSRSQRADEEAVGHQIIENAKKSGVFIDRSTLNSFGERVRKPSGESVVYVDKPNNRVVKVKDPYAKDNLKGHAASDALYEHIVHNLLFPNTQYRLIGISDDSVGDVRFVLEQDIIDRSIPATQQDIDWYLINELGLTKVEKPYLHYENDYYSITDVDASGDNVFLDGEGAICFIDPIIKFKKPAQEIINFLTTGNAIAAAEAEVDTNPTEGQKEAGNYKKGHLKLDGYDITIEQPKGSIRRGTDDNGKQWEQEMHNTYGYIRGTEGVDGDHIDVFLSDDPTSGDVFVVDQVDQMGIFDEHKVMYGFSDIESAKAAYLSNYEDGWQGCGAITPVSKEEFKKWIESSHRKTKPFAEYASVKTNGDTQLGEGSPYARYQREAEDEIQQLLDASPDRTGPVASPERTEAIQKIADMLNEADSAIEDLELNDDQKQRFQARRDAAEKWLEENVYGEGVALSVEDLKEASDEAEGAAPAEQPQAEATEETAAQPKAETKKSKWVDDEDAERFEELRRRMRELNGHLNMGVNPEQLAIGVEMSYYVIKHGTHKFADYAKQMIDALGEWVRPYLKSFYNGARDLPEMEVIGISAELTPYDEVKTFDVMNFDKEGPKDIIAMADEVVKEQDVEKQKEEAEKKLIDKRKERWQGEKKAEKPTTGDKDTTKKPKNGKKDVSLQSQMSLFDSEGTETEHKGTESRPNNTESEQPTVEEEQEAESTLKYSGEQMRKMSAAVTTDLLIGLQDGVKPYKSIVDLRRRAKSLGLEVDDEGRDDVALQEMVEDGLVRAARTIIESGNYGGSKSREAYNAICKLYDMQPTISRRSANRVKMQQYSTPLPMAFMADSFAWKPGMKKILEPTAGNGMLVFAVPAKSVIANELDETRLANLKEQGFLGVIHNDALTHDFRELGRYDAVIANPPFGSAAAKEYDGKSIAGLDEQITLNALAAMKDDGRAAIIIGGNMEYAKNGAVSNNKAFWTYLYDHYNVKGVVDMDGKLYAKQGTTYPTRMIIIDGRRSEDERAQSTVYPPRKFEAVRMAETFEDLYDIINEINQSKNRTNGNEVLRTSSKPIVSNTDNETGRTNESDTGRESNENVGNGSQREPRPTNSGRGERGDRQTEPQRVPETPRESDSGAGQPGNAGVSATQTDNVGRSAGSSERSGSERTGDTGRVHDDGVRAAGNAAGGVRVEESATPETAAPQQKEQPKQRTVEDEKLPYRPHNTAFSLESVAPAAMVEAMDNTLSEIERVHGMSIDEFVTSELGYDSIDDMHHALAAEQVDSVAMAIHNMWGGNAMIIGDQTGVGKGRQMAALIRWACKQGKKPIFITQKADLFSDIYRDLVDVGSGDLRPFIFNSDGAMVDANGHVVHKPLSSAAQAKVFAGETLPDDYDFAVLTYSQVNTGDEVSREFAKQHKDKDQRGSKQSKAVKNGKATPKATFLRKIAQDNYLFLDESHTAAGDSNVGAYIRSIIGTKAGAVIGNAGGAVEGGVKGVTFASATFAKRPDTMPMYAMRTAMSEANVKPEELIKIIEKGGVTLQEIMSRALTDSGQMVRRERDMSDVRTDWETISDPATVKRARENYDRTIAAFNAIIDFQDTYVKPLIAAKDAELSLYAESAGVKKGTDKMGVENVPFASKTYNYTKQLMLALKVDAIADRVEAEIKAGRHPVIALESTMEASIKDYTNGEVIDEPTFSASLLRGLDTVMQYTVKDEDGKETHHHYKPSDLGREGETAYYALQNAIREATSDIFISPLDAIIEKLHEKGYKVGELTGRNNYVERDADGRVVVRRRTDKDKKRMQREFNSGALDVLILNKSASTGISLHASKTFSDQRQRTMIIAQPLSDINDYMQMIGRIDRTGQIHRGYYINLGLPVPAESRFLMMLSTKLKSLNANTTTSQDSEDNSVDAPDLLNKYGSQVVVEYLRDNPSIYEKMGEPIRKGMGEKVSASELDEYKAPASDEVARKITGYVALLTTQEQEDFYNDVVRRYTDLIKYLDSTGANDLKITVMPLKAKTLRKGVSSKGNNPNGSNPFAQDAYVEEVEMDVLRKPMKADEIRSGMEQLNKLHGTEKGHLRTANEEKVHGERVLEIMGVVQRDEDARLQAEEERYEGSKARLTESIGKKRDALSKQNRSEEEKADALKKYVDEETKKVEERHEANVNKARSLTYFMREGLTNYITGRTYFLPQDLTEEGGQAGMFKVPAIFMGYKVKDDKPTPSTSFAVFATLDGHRRVEVKFTDNYTNKTIDFLTNSDYNEAQRTTLDNWDSKIPSETRKKGYIMTGNILQAVADTRDEMGNYKGQLISYTDEQGGIHDGILMPDRWEPSMLKTSGVPINAKLGEILRGSHVSSTDGKINISSNGNGHATLSVPKTKKEGAKYYENPVILRAIDSLGFWQNRGEFQADITGESNIRKVVQELSSMGVRVRDEQADNNLLSRGVSDEERIAKLESQPKMKMYRSMVLIDGKLYPPMSSKEADGKGLREPSEIGKWEESEEAPEKAVLRNGKWVFPLKKDNGKSLYAAYNPYIHTSATMLNDQFSEAQNRENLVVVEMEVPMSEMTSGYQAEKAKDSVGMKQWKAGVIQGQLNGTREVMLSRWAKPIRIVPTEEVAENIAKQIDGIITVMPSNVVTPQVREAMEKLGVKFVETDNTGKLKEGANKGRSWTSVYGKGKSVQKLMREGETEAVELEHPSEYADWMEQLWYTMPERWFDIQRGTMAYEDGVKMSKLRGYSKKRYDNMLERAEDSFKKQVMQTAERMNIGDRVQVVATADEITDEKLTEKQKSDKALYSPTSDKIYIILGNHRNMDDVMKSLLHESVAHHGLRELFGDHFDTFLDNVYAGSEESIREKIASMAAKHGWNVRTATEEYLAQMAETMDFEKPENNSWWSKVKTWFFDMLHKIGFTVKNWPGTITDNELAYVLWRSYQNMVNPGRYRSPIEIAEDTVMQDKLEVGQFESVKAKTLVRRLMVAAEGREDAYDTMLKYIEEKMIDAKTDSEALAVLNEAKELNDVVWDESEKNASKKALDNLEGMHQALVPFIDFHTQEFEEAGLIAAEPNGLLSRDGDFSPRDNAIARDYYERMVSQNGYQVQEAMQDSMLGLRKAMQAILGAGKDFKIEEVAGNENAYLAENRMSSTNAAEQHNYFRQWLEPLLKAVHEIAGSKAAEREALTNYMMAKHGLERNEKFAERDFVAYQQQYPTGGKTLADFRQNDYAGLTALTGEQDVVDAESVAQQMVADYEAQHDTSELWDAVNTATKVTLAKMYRGGLMSKDSYEHTRDMFEYYIPLRGFDETTSDEVYGYLTSRQGPLGSSILKHAEGRRSKADDPIATIAMMADQAIMQANRNEMKQRFLTFVQNHPSDLVSVSKLWLQYDAAADEWVPVFADIDEGDTAADVARKVEAFEQRMEQLAANDPDNYKSGKEAASIPYRVLPGNMNEHQVLVKRAGETFVLTINGNPRAAQALNGLTNPDVKTGGFIGGFMKASSTVNRFLSSAYTTRTPDFVVSNFFRDMLYSNCMAWVKDTPSYALRFHKNFGRFNPVTMRILFGKWENGKLDDSKPIEYMFKQFMMNGGETGYTNVRDIEAQKRRIAKELKRMARPGDGIARKTEYGIRKFLYVFGKQLDLVNQAVENCARFAAFITSQELGRSIERSIYDAKEVSVNFNKKGSGDKMMGAEGQTKIGNVAAFLSGAGRCLQVFWNAGVQGMTNFGRAAKRKPGKFAAASATMFTLGAVIPLIAKALAGDGDDDDKNAYYNLPEYVRRSNICFRVGDAWITIPLPIEFRAIYGLGELGTGVITGEEHYSDGELARQMVAQVSQILPLDFMEGQGGLHNLWPSWAKPIVEAHNNKGWTGLPIYRDTPFNQSDPEFTKVYKSADKHIVAASKWLNEITGGDDYKKGWADVVNPAQVEYVLNGYFGGYFKVPNQLIKMTETATGNREFEWRNMMIANRLIKSGDERTAHRKLQNEYFKYKEEYEETKRLKKKYEKAAEEGVVGYAEKVNFLNNSEEYARYLIFDEYRKEINDLYKLQKEETDEEQRKEYEAEYYQVMREMVDAMHEYERSKDK